MGVRRSFGPKFAEFIVKNCVPAAHPGGNGITIQTAAGKVLGAPKPGWNSDITKGLKEFAELTEIERKPKEIPESKVYRLPPPPGGLVLRVYTRGFEKSTAGELKPIERHAKDYSGPQRNFLWLTEAERRALVPRDLKEGAKFKVPDAIAQRLFCHHLIDNTIGLSGFWDAKHLRRGELWLTLTGIARTQYFFRLEGFADLANDADFAKATHKGKFTLTGRMTVHVTEGITQLDLAALGDYENAHVREYYEKAGQRKSLTLGVAFELATPGSFGYGSVPFALWQGIRSCTPDSPQVVRYFGSNPYGEKKK